jgi:hypothetical protein
VFVHGRRVSLRWRRYSLTKAHFKIIQIIKVYIISKYIKSLSLLGLWLNVSDSAVNVVSNAFLYHSLVHFIKVVSTTVVKNVIATP